MYTEDEREELIETFRKLKVSVDDCLENHKVMPASITHNGEKVGITIEFRKIHPEDKGV